MNYFLFFRSLLGICLVPGIISISIKIIFNHRNRITKEFENSTENYISSWERRIKAIISILSFSCGFLMMLYFFIKGNHYIAYIIIIAVLMDNINKGYFYSEKIIELLRNFKNNDLSNSEWNNILGFISAISMVITYKVPDKFISYFNTIQNKFISDLFLLIFLFLFSMLSIFLSGLLLFEFSKLLFQLVSKIITLIFGKKTIKFFYRIERLHHENKENSLTISYIKKNKIRSIVLFLMIFIFIIDVIYSMVYYLYKILIGVLFYMLLIIYRIYKTGKKIKFWFCNLSDRKVMIVFFRISFVLASISLVAFNRISPLTRMSNESTEILEFIASSLLIPIVLSWLMEYKNLQHSDDENKNLIISKRRILSKRKYK